MLELVATMFLGLLLKIDMVNAAEEERSRVFDLTVATVTGFIFAYPVVTFLLTSEKVHKLLSSLMNKLASKVSHLFQRRQQRLTATTTDTTNATVKDNDAAANDQAAADTTSASTAGQATKVRKGNRVAPKAGEGAADAESAPTNHAERYMV